MMTRSEIEAKRILKAFGKAEFKSRVEYVDSYLPEKTSFWESISYRHAFRRAGMVAVLVILIMALGASTYAAVMYRLNLTKTVDQVADRYVSEYSDDNGDGLYDGEVTYYEPTSIPSGFELVSDTYDEIFKIREWSYKTSDNKVLTIEERPPGNAAYYFDNERSERSVLEINDIEVVVYEWKYELAGMFQYEDLIVIIDGSISKDDLRTIIENMDFPG